MIGPLSEVIFGGYSVRGAHAVSAGGYVQMPRLLGVLGGVILSNKFKA